MLRLIQSAEVLAGHAPPFGRETAELVPGRVADFRARGCRPRLQRAGNVHAVAKSRAAGALLLFIGLVAGERAAGVEQFAVQALLALDGARVEAPRFELARELARFLREGARGARVAAGLQALELPGELALARGLVAHALQCRVAA